MTVKEDGTFNVDTEKTIWFQERFSQNYQE